MSEPTFLDTGIFVALLNRRDRWHGEARALFDGRRPRWCTSYLVVSEAYSWFLHRHGEEPARALRTFIDGLDGLRVLEATAEHHGLVVRMLDRLRGARLTYVDASSLCFMATHRIRTAWSTDHHLGLTGARVLPGSG